MKTYLLKLITGVKISTPKIKNKQLFNESYNKNLQKKSNITLRKIKDNKKPQNLFIVNKKFLI